ncbi:putative cytoplasmic protein [Staphylococcus aureus]|nr:putative cytoplasmic protein [Staphylococcus aureus]
MKAHGSTVEGHWKLENLSAEEESGIPCVAVKCAEIWRNTSGEGDFLVCN